MKNSWWFFQVDQGELTVTEEELVKLRGEGREQAAKSCNQPANDSCYPSWLPHAQRYRYRWQSQGHPSGQRSEAPWNKTCKNVIE